MNEVVYPGKEVVGLLFGIAALVSGIFALLTTWLPVYGWIFGGICAVCTIIDVIVTKVQWGTIKKNATSFTSKIKNGNGMATAGLIMAIISIVILIISVIVCIVILAAVGAGAGMGAFDDIFDALGF